jgi:predicted esterase
MRWFKTLFILTWLSSPSTSAFSDWKADLNQLLIVDAESAQAALIQKIVAADPDWQDIAAYLQNLSFPDIPMRGTTLLNSTICLDGVQRPWVLYIPPGYKPAQPSPLLVILHGAVSRETISENPQEDANRDAFLQLARDLDAFAVFPSGQAGATWWDRVGMENIRNLVRTVKRQYNIDDDRVAMAGFSDGASAAFLHAMVDPTDYAAFVALNGHMGVGSRDGGLATYAPNMMNTPIYAVTTDRDELYPSEKMRSIITMARKAGGDLFYRELEGAHDLDYAGTELHRIARFLERHPRDPFPHQLVWETASKQFGQCRWFAIDTVTSDAAAGWHIDHNAILVDDRITIGFMPADWESDGVKVGKVAEKSFAEKAGLLADDIVIKGNQKPIRSMDDLNAFKTGLRRGDAVELTVLRNGQKVILKGNLPEASSSYLFKRDVSSSMARVSLAANRVQVETSRVGAFRLLVHPDMIRPEINLLISVNGRTVYDRKVRPDLTFLLRNFLENRDRRLIYIAEVKIDLPE